MADEKAFSRLRISALLLLGCITFSFSARAQTTSSNLVTLTVSTDPTNAVLVNSPLTYLITVSNSTFVPLQNVSITNAFPVSLQFSAANTSYPTGWTYRTNATGLVFYLTQIFGQSVADLSVTVTPQAAGPATNLVTVFSPQFTNLLQTNIVIQVTNTPTVADLAVTLSAPTTNVLVNDLIYYRMAVTNRGPDPASSVALTNTLSSGVKILSSSPPGKLTADGRGLSFNLGTLTNGAVRYFNVQIQPTNSTNVNITAVARNATLGSDPALSNNLAAAAIPVADFVPASLSVGILSNMTFNPQTSLMEQAVRLSNIGSNSVPSARVMIRGVTNRLVNAVGTNASNPFVNYAAPLDPGKSADLLLEYYIPSRQPAGLTESNYFAAGVPGVDLSPPENPGTAVGIGRMVRLPSGNVLLEFPAMTNRAYTVVYGSDLRPANARIAAPSVMAPGNRAEWIDYGPPGTVSDPATNTARFYRVYLNPEIP